MESSAGALSPGIALPQSDRPSWVRITVLTFVAWLAWGLGLWLTMGVLSIVGLQSSNPDSLAAFDWPRPAVDPWALLADVAHLLGSCFLLAWVMRSLVRNWTRGWDIRLWPMALAAAIGIDSGITTIQVAGFALFVVVARQVALAPSPAPRWNPRLLVRVEVGLGVAVLALAALSYQPFHPLAGAFEGRPSDASFSIGGLSDRRSSEREHEFMLGNDGIASMTVRSIRPVGDRPSAVVVVTNREHVQVAHSLGAFEREVGVERIARGKTFSARMRMTAAACLDPIRPIDSVRVRGLDVRYEALGVTRTQRLAIDPPARLRCHGRS